MKEHRYRITVEHLSTPREDSPLHAPLRFESGNHDEILGIVDRMRERGRFDDDTAAALAVGLKLFGEVVLQHRKESPFAEIREPLHAFIGAIKGPGKPTPDHGTE